MEIYDAHIRFFSKDFYEFRGGGEPDAASAPPDPRDRKMDLLAELDRCGISRAVLISFLPGEAELAGSISLDTGDRLIPYAAVDPSSPPSLESIRSAQARCRFRGLALYPAVHDCPLGGGETAPALNLAREHGLVVLLDFGGARPGVRALMGLAGEGGVSLDDVLQVAVARRDQCFILSHTDAAWGEELLQLGRSCPNVYLDTAGLAGAHPARGRLAAFLNDARAAFGSARILYGSDSDALPGGYRTDALAAQRDALEQAGFTGKERAGVLGKNLARLLALR